MAVPANPAQSQAESANPDFWDGAMSGGLVVNGVMRDIFAYRDASLVSGPVYDTGPQGPLVGFNRTARSGQTIDAPYLNLDNRGALSYWIYGTFTGSPSGDEDTLGLQWSGLQGDVDNDARRVLFRYASNSNALQWFAYFTNFTTTNHSAPANISDGLPHLIGFSFSRPGVTLFVDDQVYEFTADGDLANLSTAKHPEILGGHTVTRTGRSEDSPRFDLYSWGMLSRGLSSAEIQTLASEPHAAFVPADVSQTVDVQTAFRSRVDSVVETAHRALAEYSSPTLFRALAEKDADTAFAALTQFAQVAAFQSQAESGRVTAYQSEAESDAATGWRALESRETNQALAFRAFAAETHGTAYRLLTDSQKVAAFRAFTETETATSWRALSAGETVAPIAFRVSVERSSETEFLVFADSDQATAFIASTESEQAIAYAQAIERAAGTGWQVTSQADRSVAYRVAVEDEQQTAFGVGSRPSIQPVAFAYVLRRRLTMKAQARDFHNAAPRRRFNVTVRI